MSQIDQLKKRALSTGAHITLPDGSIFNASRRKIEGLKMRAKSTTDEWRPVLDALVVVANETRAASAAFLAAFSEHQKSVEEILQQVKALADQEPVEPPTYDCTVRRDTAGNIKGVLLKPTRNK